MLSSLIFETGGIYWENLHLNEETLKIQKDFYYYNFSGKSTPLLKNSTGNFVSSFNNDNKLIYLEPKSSISCFSLLINQIEWENNLESFGETRKILGVKDNKLWISIYRAGSNKDQNVLLALDILTGEVVYQSPPDYDLSDCFVKLIPECNSVISIYGKISSHGPADSPFVEINATTGETIRNQRIESLYHENLKIGQWKYFENKIYFTASKDTINSTHIGVLDYETLDLLWYTEVIDRKAGLRDIQITKDKIYVLDSGNQLHIYEKE